MMFGLAQTTVAVWVLADTAFFHKEALDEYNVWAWSFAKKLYTHGMIWTAAAGTWYVFGTWTPELRSTMFSGPLLVLTVVTAVATGLPWLMIVTERRCPAKLPLIAGICLAQVGVMAVNAVSRQVVQNIDINRYVNRYVNEAGLTDYNVLNQATATQWGPLMMFLVVFVVGLLVVGWMIRQVVKETAETAT